MEEMSVRPSENDRVLKGMRNTYLAERKESKYPLLFGVED